ncbi:hypothetical protein EDC04DRAFT_2897081 [Pisolithus marmoratus]|nr:hypothetical protein EDC04DRAFT_2897081 [Pisolithus marmoratus]
MQRRTSDAPVPNLNDLGKDVPLSSAPTSWPLYVVEIKAGRTDLFYLTGLTRGVKAFEHEQRERFAYGDGGPLSLGGQKGSKKDIHLNMIYGETQPQDRQFGSFPQVMDPWFLILGLCRQLVAKAQGELTAMQL